MNFNTPSHQTLKKIVPQTENSSFLLKERLDPYTYVSNPLFTPQSKIPFDFNFSSEIQYKQKTTPNQILNSFQNDKNQIKSNSKPNLKKLSESNLLNPSVNESVLYKELYDLLEKNIQNESNLTPKEEKNLNSKKKTSKKKEETTNNDFKKYQLNNSIFKNNEKKTELFKLIKTNMFDDKENTITNFQSNQKRSSYKKSHMSTPVSPEKRAQKEKGLVEISVDLSTRWSDKNILEKYSPIQNKSLLSNINEILSLINKEESIDKKDLDEKKPKINEKKKVDLMQVYEITNHINETLKNMQGKLKNKSPIENNFLINEQSDTTKIKESQNQSENILETFDLKPEKQTNYSSKESIKNFEQIIKKLGISNISSEQLYCLKSLLQNNSCLLSTNNPNYLIYQICSYFFDNLVVVITTKTFNLKEELLKISGEIAWATLNKFLTEDQKTKIFNHISNKEIKLLFISPEILISDSYFIFNNVDLLIIDDADNYIDDLNGFYYSYYFNNMYNIIDYKTILHRFNPNQKLFISKIIPYNTLNSLKFIYDIEYENIFCPQFEKMNFNNIHIINENDKLKALKNLIKNIRSKKRSNFIIFSKKNNKVKISNSFKKDGLKIICLSNKNEEIFEDNKLILDFYKTNNEIILTDYHNNLPSKNINYIILFDIPENLEKLSNEIINKKENTKIIIFFNQNDYFDIRNELLKSHFNQSQLENLLKYIFNNNTNNPEKKKEDFKKRRRLSMFPIFDDECINLIENKNNFDESYENLELINLKLTELKQNTNLKKSDIVKILKFLEDIQWIKIINYIPLKVLVKLNGTFPISNTYSKIFKSIIKNTLNLKGQYEFWLADVAKDMGISVTEIFESLKKLQEEECIKIKIKEELLSFKITYLPSNFDLDQKINEIYNIYKEENNVCFKKLDILYVFLKNFSFLSLENFSRNEKKNKLSNNLTIKQIIQKYLEIEENTKFDTFFAELGISIENIIPLQKINKKRDRTEINKDFEELLNEQFELLNFQFLAENKKFNMNEFSDKTIENIAKILVQIMNGNTLDNKLNSKFQKSKFWKKYFKNDQNELLEIAIEVLYERKCWITKKLKK